MSESDSDLDFESADEDASFDANSKNESQCCSDSAVISAKPTEIKPSEINIEACSNDSLQKDNPETENLQIPDTRNIHRNDPKNNSSLEKGDSEGELSKNISSDSAVKENIAESSCANKTENNFETSTKVIHEKQRVPLRLEKKMQQKQQMSKEDSVDKSTASPSASDASPKKLEMKSSWGFGGWGTNLLSSAASSVSTFTNQVSQGIGTVLETVENTLGAPPPEELAASLDQKDSTEDSIIPSNKVEERKNFNEVEIQDKNASEIKSSILPNVSSWTKVLENTGSKVLMSGLDTLEFIGKKTIDIITEGDPGLRKKRAAFDGISLSQILREAKAEADECSQDKGDNGIETVHYSQMFDEYQGLVHLEALEMLSKQSEAKIQMLLMRIPRNAEVRKNMEEIKSICENIPQSDDPTDCGDFEDFLTVCKKYVLELNITFNVENILKAQKRITDVLKNYEDATAVTSTPEEIYHSAICSLAEFTAKAIEAFHKLSELILVQPTLEPNVEHFATNLTGLTTVICIEINNLSSRYHRCLDSMSEQCERGSSNKSNITTVVTNLYLEAANSNKYIQDAFLLLVPVLQVSLLESSQ